jgi:hypothetical protein
MISTKRDKENKMGMSKVIDGSQGIALCMNSKAQDSARSKEK